MTRLKNGNEQESRAAPKWIRWELVVIILLIVSLVAAFCYNAFAENVTTAYASEGYCMIKVGDATMRVNVKYGGTDPTLQKDGQYRANFVGRSQPVYIKDTQNKDGTLIKNLKISSTKSSDGWVHKGTVLDGGDKSYTTVLFSISFTLPAHYYLNGQSKSKNSRGRLPHGHFKFVAGANLTGDSASYDDDYDFSKNAGHSGSNRTVSIVVRLQLGNAGMIQTSDETTGIPDWFHTTLSTFIYRKSYTFTYNTAGGTVTSVAQIDQLQQNGQLTSTILFTIYKVVLTLLI